MGVNTIILLAIKKITNYRLTRQETKFYFLIMIIIMHR